MQNISESTPAADVQPVPFQLHGVLIRVDETGVLLLGESGIGKSECALDLLTAGHRLVADDVVDISREGAQIVGRAPALTRDLLEVRGLGIINVRELFGESSVCSESTVDLCIELQGWTEVERIGRVVGEHIIAGLAVPKFTLPVGTGRNLATLVATAVRIFRGTSSPAAATESLLNRHAALLSSNGEGR